MTSQQQPFERIFIPLDTPDLERALEIASSLKGLVGGVKIGKEFFTALGPEGVARVTELGMPLFADLKFHDIPNTVAGAVRSAVHLKPSILNIHAQGGRAMMIAACEAAAEEAAKIGVAVPLILGVTVLTSLDDQDLNDIGVSDNTLDHVKRLAALAQECGLDGVVCSAAEIEALRKICGAEFKLLTPGIRPSWAAAGDQKRIVTPGEAIKRGADYLVIGRPIYGADDPAEAARKIAAEIDEALG
ncbi:MAG: orotidine-5'-phosphate decarboxylase [Rhodospirillaceae bacterium]|jgi:orotidine-5'-phosphate decarboxylase|nr:orotidine-5'-phosphate decarboxylase [Rhodospirillaceae bacterium]MBT4588821.1 orotidine-5'-phosphate decarboxylase [Rhodospirillaceae bacterium]MBT4941128.1 orotidine-5'-phosphate decarboxylase [Rhodospirillaceae bacterium]MBT7266769.1 orotidine-5'-phosphate decarboxylase [Rhodospirillaceae bacterium]